MSLLKIPLLLSLALTHYVSATPPGVNAHQRKNVAKTTIAERILLWVSPWVWLTPTVTLFLFLFSACECVTLLALAFPSMPYSQLVLSNLLPPQPFGSLTPAFLFGALLANAGMIGRLLCYRALGPMFSFTITQRPTDKLVTSGPYSIVRHPGYSCFLAMYAGICICLFMPLGDSWLRASGYMDGLGGTLFFGGWYLMWSTVSWLLIRRAPIEDGMLRKRYGRDWDAWAAKVRYRILPGIY